MNFNLIPFEGTDSIKFGMTSTQIRDILNMKPELFKKTQFDLLDTEDYKGICHVFYEQGNIGEPVCAAFEIFKPSKVFLEGKQLIGENKDIIQALFNDKYEDCVSDAYGTSSKSYDIAFYTPRKNIASVFIARKGYSREQEEFYQKAYAEKYSVPEDIEDSTMRKRLCPSCMSITTAKEGDICPQCNEVLI